MEITINFVPTIVGPTKLEQVLAQCKELSHESNEKVCVIQDIAKLGKLLCMPPITPSLFYDMYDTGIKHLESIQHELQIQWNTRQYHMRTGY